MQPEAEKTARDGIAARSPPSLQVVVFLIATFSLLGVAQVTFQACCRAGWFDVP